MSGPGRDDLDREEAIARVLRQRAEGVHIPSFTVVEARLARRTSVPLVVLSATALVVVALVVGGLLAERRSRVADPQATPPLLPSASPATTDPASPFFLLIGRTASADGRPEALARLDILSLEGEVRASHELTGLLGTPVYDGATRVAYWRRAPGAIASELIVWDMARDAARTVYRSESRAGVPIWSAGRDHLTFALENGALPDSLVALDVASGSSRELAVFSDRPPVDPIYADQRVIAGYGRGGAYEVIDAGTGQLRSTFPTSSFVGYGGTRSSRDGMVFDLKTRFEAPSRPLYVFKADAPRDPVAVVEQGELHDPIFRPGRTELFYGDGLDLRVIDYSTGRSEGVHAFPRTDFGWPTPIAFDDRGEHLLVRSHAGFQVFAVRDRRLEHAADARVPDPRVAIIGLIRADALR